RGAANAEEVRDDAELRDRVHLPDRLAVGDVDAVQHSFGAVDVDAVAVDDRAGAWAAIVAVHVLVVGRICELPVFVAGGPGAAAQAGEVARTVKEIDAAARDGRRTVPFAEVRLPDEAEAFFRPGSEDTFFGRDAVAGRTEESRPVAAGTAGWFAAQCDRV